MADEPLRVTSCPHCGGAAEEVQGVCANCGALLGGVWPPPPSGCTLLLPPMPPKTLTGRIWADFLLGVVGQYLLHLATARVLVRYVPTISHSRDWIVRASVPGGFVLTELFWAVVFGLLTYCGLRRLQPVVARGSGYATLLLLVVLLGVFFTRRPLLY